MTGRFLPKSNTEDAEKLVKEYSVCKNRDELDTLAKKWNFATTNDFTTAMSRRFRAVFPDALRRRKIVEVNKETILNLPKIDICDYKPLDMSAADPEEQVLLLSDGHAGRITPTFNNAIYTKRMEILTEKVMMIADLHRHMYPINKLHIIDLGDGVQGENPYQGSKIGTTSMGARDQIAKLALPSLLKLILSLKQRYTEIVFDGFPGNHGRYGKESPETSNWDIFRYDCLKASLGDTPNIQVNIHSDFGGVLNIAGYKFFCFHGDEIPVTNGIPLFALTRRIDKWYQQFDGFDYAVCGHFHKYLNDEISSKVELFMNGTIVSDDTWALKVIGISSVPSQWTFGVHKKHGVTWRYPLFLNKPMKV